LGDPESIPEEAGAVLESKNMRLIERYNKTEDMMRFIDDLYTNDDHGDQDPDENNKTDGKSWLSQYSRNHLGLFIGGIGDVSKDDLEKYRQIGENFLELSRVYRDNCLFLQGVKLSIESPCLVIECIDGGKLGLSLEQYRKHKEKVASIFEEFVHIKALAEIAKSYV
jgi:hypothetical protein